MVMTWGPSTEPDPVIPNRISAMQARRALLAVGMLDQVEAWADDPATDRDARLCWEYASHLHRDHPMVTSIGALLDLSDAQIDDLFIAAAAIN